MGVRVPEIELLIGDSSPVPGYIADRTALSATLATIFGATTMGYLAQIMAHDHTFNPIDIPWNVVGDGGLSGLPIIRPNDPPLEGIGVGLPEWEGGDVNPPGFAWNLGEVPPWNVTAPDFFFPPVPVVVWPVLTAVIPNELPLDIPLAPDVILPPAPTLDGVAIPSPPNINFPTFDGVAPSMDLTPPDAMFTWNEAEYDSELMQALQAKLLTDIVNGGTGLGADIEAAIWARALARQLLENEKAYNEGLNYWSSKGFTLPQGALASRLTEVRNRIDQTNEDLNNDILVQQSKLAQENTHFIITSVINTEKMIMDDLNNRNQRLFEAAKYTIEASILLYQARIEGYKAQLEAYKTYAVVYEAQIRAEVARIEIYKAQIEGAKLTVEVQALMIEAYKAQLEGVLAEIEVYKSQMQAVAIVADVNKTRIEAYKVQVDAYSSQVGAITARFNAYQAQIAGEAAKADAYESESKAYVAQVEGYKVQGELQIMEAEVEMKATQAEVTVFEGYVEKYKAEVQRYIAQAEAIAKEQGYLIDKYEAETKLYAVDTDVHTKLYMGRIEQVKNYYDVQIRQAEANVRTTISQFEYDTDTHKTMAQVYAQLSAAAIATVSASAHIGFSQSMSDSTSQNASATNSASSQTFTDITAGTPRISENTEHIHHYEG